MAKEIKVFLVDDSAVVRHMITKLIESSGRNIKVVGGAPNGKIALMKMIIPKYKPDVVLVDAIMPEMDGFETIGHIMDRFPTPVIMVSGLSKLEVNRSLSNLGMSAFESGMVEFVKKPDAAIKHDDKRFKRELVYKIRNLSKVDIVSSYAAFDFKSFIQEDEKEIEKIEELNEIIEVVEQEEVLTDFVNSLIIIGASTGGPRAISLILSKISPDFPPIIIVQHMPELMGIPWVNRLQNLYPHLKISIAADGEKIRPNRIYIAPGGKHCSITTGKAFHLFEEERINYVIPAIDVTFASAAKVFKENTLGIVLTGMGKDGLEGAKRIKAVKGKILVEHESTCIIPSMPMAIIEASLADFIVPLHNIPATIQKYRLI